MGRGTIGLYEAMKDIFTMVQKADNIELMKAVSIFRPTLRRPGGDATSLTGSQR
jgi:hypothetical protein